MSNAVLIHGITEDWEYLSDKYPSLSNSHWFPWLQKQLTMKGILTQTPEMPDATNPAYENWKSEFERYDVNEDTLLVGHSCGGGFLTRWLSENDKRVKKLVLVAPWLDPKNTKNKNFFNFKIDSNLPDRIEEIHIFVSEDDDDDILESVEIIKKGLSNINLHTYKDKGHFNYGAMKTDEFPDLLEALLA